MKEETWFEEMERRIPTGEVRTRLSQLLKSKLVKLSQ